MKLILFKASWCKHCDTQIEEYEKNELKVPLIMVDVSTTPNSYILCKRFKVNDVPTSVLVDDKFELSNEDTWTEENVHKIFVDFISTDKINEYLKQND